MSEIVPANNLPAAPVCLASAYLASLAPGASREGMASTIRVITRIMSHGRTSDHRAIPWQALTAAHVAAIVSSAEGAPATKAKILAALRGIARAGYQSGVVSADDMAKIRGVKSPRGKRLKKGRMIRDGELSSIFAACAADPSPSGVRDHALLAVATQTGMRRAELCALHAEHMTREVDAWTGSVVGKGNKERRIFLVDDAVAPFDRWMALRGDAPGPVFRCVTRTGKILPRGMTTTALHFILARRMAQAGLSDFSWHDFRRSVITRLIAGGIDMPTIAAMVGHSSVKTTQDYDRRGEEAIRDAARTIKLPKP